MTPTEARRRLAEILRTPQDEYARPGEGWETGEGDPIPADVVLQMAAEIEGGGRMTPAEIIAYLQAPGHEREAWEVVSAVAPPLAGPERDVDPGGYARARWRCATCAMLYRAETRREVEARAVREGVRLVPGGEE